MIRQDGASGSFSPCRMNTRQCWPSRLVMTGAPTRCRARSWPNAKSKVKYDRLTCNKLARNFYLTVLNLYRSELATALAG